MPRVSVLQILEEIGIVEINDQVLGQLTYEREARQHQSL